MRLYTLGHQGIGGYRFLSRLKEDFGDMLVNLLSNTHPAKLQ